MRGKIRIKNREGGRQKIKIKYLAAAIIVAAASAGIIRRETRAEACPNLRAVFARGSGGERWTDQNYLAFKNAIAEKLATTSLRYEFIDLDYPAVGVGLDNLATTAGAFFGAGDAYEFGASVNAGVRNLKAIVNNAACPGTKYVLGGYSQGAMVVSKGLANLNPGRIIYAATFGDPKLYLPEGRGIFPEACRGAKLSSYRMYVPDCQAYKGLLGAYVPYEPETLSGKVGTWCNKRDIFCSSHLSISDHTAYVSENLYEDASKVIFSKITRAFNVPNYLTSLHDTVILVDSTGSMQEMIDRYKAEATRLAEKTLASGGRVALYDYRDLDDPYEVHERCNFNTCDAESFARGLEAIEVDGGGDEKESLLSAAWHVMQRLNWQQGATKSIVVLTDAGPLLPDRDHTTLDMVVRLSKQIDPVNFYVITGFNHAGEYLELVEGTDGRAIYDLSDAAELTDYIMERFDSLPRVEEADTVAELPTLEVVESSDGTDEIRIKFRTTGARTLVALNGRVLGITNETEITLSGVDFADENEVVLVPLGEDVRGEAVAVGFGGRGADFAGDSTEGATGAAESATGAILKAPNTGGKQKIGTRR